MCARCTWHREGNVMPIPASWLHVFLRCQHDSEQPRSLRRSATRTVARRLSLRFNNHVASLPAQPIPPPIHPFPYPPNHPFLH
jgi:hypothetical protein